MQERNKKKSRLPEMKTIIKSLYRLPCPHDNCHRLSKSEQVVIVLQRIRHSHLIKEV